MTRPRPGGTTRARLKEQLQRTPECIPIDQLGAVLQQRDRNHLAMCTRCQTELALWREFTASSTLAADDESASRVAAELRRRRLWTHPRAIRATRKHWWAPLNTRTFVAAAASLVLVVAAGRLAWDPEPSVDKSASVGPTYRSAGIRVLSPIGELDQAPGQLTWIAVDGAVRYDVRVLEVDGTVLWSAASPSPAVRLPAAVVAKFVPGKTILWDVTARSIGSVPLAQSGTQRVRVQVFSFPRR